MRDGASEWAAFRDLLQGMIDHRLLMFETYDRTSGWVHVHTITDMIASGPGLRFFDEAASEHRSRGVRPSFEAGGDA